MQQLKSNHNRNQIAKRLILAILLCGSIITLITTGVQLYSEYRGDLRMIHAGIESIRDSHLATLSHSVWLMDSELIQIELNGLLGQRDLEYVAIETVEGQSWSAGQSLSEKKVSVELPLEHYFVGEEKTDRLPENCRQP